MKSGPQKTLTAMQKDLYHCGQDRRLQSMCDGYSIRSLNWIIHSKDPIPKRNMFKVLNPVREKYLKRLEELFE